MSETRLAGVALKATAPTVQRPKSMARSLGASTASSTTTRLIGTRPVVLDSAVNTSVEGWGGGGAVRREFGSGMSGLSGEGYGGTVHPN